MDSSRPAFVCFHAALQLIVRNRESSLSNVRVKGSYSGLLSLIAPIIPRSFPVSPALLLVLFLDLLKILRQIANAKCSCRHAGRNCLYLGVIAPDLTDEAWLDVRLGIEAIYNIRMVNAYAVALGLETTANSGTTAEELTPMLRDVQRRRAALASPA